MGVSPIEKGGQLRLGWLRMGGGALFRCTLWPWTLFPSVLLGIAQGRRLHLDYSQMSSKDFAWQCFPGSVLQDTRALVCRKPKWGGVNYSEQSPSSQPGLLQMAGRGPEVPEPPSRLQVSLKSGAKAPLWHQKPEPWLFLGVGGMPAAPASLAEMLLFSALQL